MAMEQRRFEQLAHFGQYAFGGCGDARIRYRTAVQHLAAVFRNCLVACLDKALDHYADDEVLPSRIWCATSLSTSG